MAPKSVALALRSVNKTYGSVRALSGFSLDVAEGELVSLLGPSGCGKTTALRVVAGFEQPDSGSVYIGGGDVTSVPPERRDVGMVFQSYALFPHMTVAANVAFPMMIRGRPRSEVSQAVSHLLSMVQLEGLENRYPHQLSGGQRQRVALARALAKKPSILLLDEPLSALDAKIREQLRAEIRRLQTNLGITTIYVTHDQEEALSISDRVVVMHGGVIEQEGPPSEIYKHPLTFFVASFVGTSAIFPCQVVGLRSPHIIEARWKEQLFVVKFDSQRGTEEGTNGIEVGTRVGVVVRPEHIRVIDRSHEKPPTENCLEGTVEVLAFHGASVTAHVRLDPETEIRALVNSAESWQFSSGKPVWVGFSSSDARLVWDKGR